LPKFNLEAVRRKTKKGKIKNKILNIDAIKEIRMITERNRVK
jgi:hypothetical protein